METTIKIADFVTIDAGAQTTHFGRVKSEDIIHTGKFYISGFGDGIEQERLTKALLSDMYQLAYRAHSGTSFSPDKRAEQVVKEYSAELAQDLAKIPESERAQYQANYIKYLSAWLSAKSNCISTMITGGSNFPVRRAEKANRSEHNRSEEFSNWRSRALESIGKRIDAAKPQAVKDDEEFARIKDGILSSCGTIIGIDNGTERGYSRALFVTNMTGKITRLANNGRTDLVIKCLELIKQINSTVTKPVVSASNSIWKLGEQAEATREAQFDKANSENIIIPFSGGEIILNYGIDRIQIKHESKPVYEVISILKKNAFKWSPSQGVWQRQLTNNAIYATQNILDVRINTTALQMVNDLKGSR